MKVKEIHYMLDHIIRYIYPWAGSLAFLTLGLMMKNPYLIIFSPLFGLVMFAHWRVE